MSHPQVVLGLDFGGTKIAVAVCDLAGNKLASAVVSSRGELGAEASFAHGIETAQRMLRMVASQSSQSSQSRLTAVGVSTFGIPFEDRVELAPAIKGWESLAFGRELAAAFPDTEVRIATDAKAAAGAEVRWGALAGYDPAIYLNLGTGLAAAIVSGGQVLTGHHGAAGEIGYSLREHADVGLASGRRLVLEDMVSGLALARRAAKAGRPGTAADVFAAAQTNPAMDELVTAFVRELAFHLVNLAILIDPARVAVGGGMVRSWDRIRPVLASALAQAVPYPPELVLAHFPHEAPLLGAVALAIDASGGPGTRYVHEDTTRDQEVLDGLSWTDEVADDAPAISTTGKQA
jgi:predicted NBD/HSP70 family sugar kinase